MSIFIKYCSQCGWIKFSSSNNMKCPVCNAQIYYAPPQLTTEKYKGMSREDLDNFIIETSGHPLNMDLRKDLEAYENKIHMDNLKYSTPRTQPQCPTCKSTNIKRISTGAKVAGAMAFGVLSKTARSQFCCNNCGYKW